MNNLIYMVPGFVSYVFLRPFGLFNFFSEADRQLTLIILSIINSAASSVLTRYWLHPWLGWGDSLGTLMFVSVMITIVYFIIFSLYNKFSAKIADLLNMNLYDNQGTMEHVLSQIPAGNQEQFIIVFDFDNKYISSGFVRNVDDQGNQQVELYGQDEYVFSIDDARGKFKENDLNSIVVDYKNKIKTYVILVG